MKFSKSCGTCIYNVKDVIGCQSHEYCNRMTLSAWQPNDETAKELCSQCKHKDGYFCAIAPGQKSDWSCFESKCELKRDSNTINKDPRECKDCIYNDDPDTCHDRNRWIDPDDFSCFKSKEETIVNEDCDICKWYVNNRCKKMGWRWTSCKYEGMKFYEPKRNEARTDTIKTCENCGYGDRGNKLCNYPNQTGCCMHYQYWIPIKDDSMNKINCKFYEMYGEWTQKPLCRSIEVIDHYNEGCPGYTKGKGKDSGPNTTASICPFHTTEDAQLKCKFFEDSARYIIKKRDGVELYGPFTSHEDALNFINDLVIVKKVD